MWETIVKALNEEAYKKLLKACEDIASRDPTFMYASIDKGRTIVIISEEKWRAFARGRWLREKITKDMIYIVKEARLPSDTYPQQPS